MIAHVSSFRMEMRGLLRRNVGPSFSLASRKKNKRGKFAEAAQTLRLYFCYNAALSRLCSRKEETDTNRTSTFAFSPRYTLNSLVAFAREFVFVLFMFELQQARFCRFLHVKANLLERKDFGKDKFSFLFPVCSPYQYIIPYCRALCKHWYKRYKCVDRACSLAYLEPDHTEIDSFVLSVIT